MVPEITAPASSWSSPKEVNGAAKLHPEQLLMATREGDSELLNNLLNKQDDAVFVDIIKKPTPADKVVIGTPLRPTVGLDSILHVVASSGDRDGFLKSADVIYTKDKDLLETRNGNGDMPLQCAARAGNAGMVSHLINLAKTGVGGHARLKEMLRNQNKQGETALHDALRLADKKMVREMVKKLFQFDDDADLTNKYDDAELARFESTNGTSPLYLAVMLGRDDIAEILYHTAKRTEEGGQRRHLLSYSGPDGQNVLHAAVLRGYATTNKILEWNNGLTKQRDVTTGCTPLHMAATWGRKNRRVIELLLHADKSSAFLSDNTGSFPIHAAAARVTFSVLRIIVNKCPGCAGLQDAEGKTFLHIAAEKERSLVLLFACWQRRFAPILNIRDNDGNTALHLAAKAGNQWSFYSLIQNPRVQLDLVNNKGKAPMDISEKWKPEGIIFALDPRYRIHLLLKGAAANNGIYRRNWSGERRAAKKIYYEDYEKQISDSAQIIGVGSVLIVTVAFAAAFTLPGAFLNGEHYGGKSPCTLHGGDDRYCAGKATLAYDEAFRAFIITNTLALSCSALATMNVMFSGVAAVDIRTRMCSFLISVYFLYCSAKFLVAAFLFGLFAVLPHDALVIAYISTAITVQFLFLDVLWFIKVLAIGELMLIRRLGWITWFLTFDGRRMVFFIIDIFRVLFMPLPGKKPAPAVVPEKEGCGPDKKTSALTEGKKEDD